MAGRGERSVGKMVLLFCVSTFELHKPRRLQMVPFTHTNRKVSKYLTWVQLPLTTLPTLASLETKRKKRGKIVQT